MHYRFLLVLYIGVLSLTLKSCKDENQIASSGDDLLSASSSISTTLIGEVINEAGLPVRNVAVHAHGFTNVTDQSGRFIFNDISVPENRCIVTCVKDGYFTSIRAIKPNEGNSSYVQVILMSNTTTHKLNAEAGGTAELINGSSVKLEPNSLLLPTGTRYTGDVNMSIRYLDHLFQTSLT